MNSGICRTHRRADNPCKGALYRCSSLDAYTSSRTYEIPRDVCRAFPDAGIGASALKRFASKKGDIMNCLHRKMRWLGWLLGLVLSNALAQGAANCVTAQQNAANSAMLSGNLTQAEQNRLEAQATMRKCLARYSHIGCGREVDQFNLADQNYWRAERAVDENRATLCR